MISIDKLDQLMSAKGARDLVRNEIVRRVAQLPAESLTRELAALLRADEHASDLLRHVLEIVDPLPEVGDPV